MLNCRQHLISIVTVLVLLFFGTHGFAYTFHIMAFGDSITQGFKRTADGIRYGILNPPNGARTSDGYEPELENDFAAQTPHTAYVYNWGYGGERTYQGVNRIDTVLDSREADFILIMEGANDLYSGLSASATKTNLSIMIDKSLAKQTVPIIATVTPNTAPNQPDGYIIPASYNPAIKSLASEKGVVLADQYAALVGNWSGYNSGDGLHLNDSGEWVMAQTWFNAIMDHGLPRPFTVAPMLKLMLNGD
jgi:lysophospholipase L1-like esterase